MEQIYSSVTAGAATWLQAVVDSLLPSIVLTAAVGLLFRYSNRLNARSRYIVLWVVLAVVTSMPAIGLGWNAFDNWRTSSLYSRVSTTHYSAHVHEGVSAVPVGDAVVADRTRSGSEGSRGTAPGSQTDNVAGPRTSETFGLGQPPQLTTFQALLGLLPVSLLAVWLIVSSACLIRLGAAYFHLRVVIANSTPADTHVSRRLERLRLGARCSRPISVRTSTTLTSPAATGFRRGTILLPDSLVGLLSDDELDSILIHEMSHLQRRDDWSRLVEQLLLSLAFYNPALHWLIRQLDLYREIACDDAVVTRLQAPNAYARTLAKLAEMDSRRARLALAPGAVLTRKHIFTRFSMLLNRNRTVTTGLPKVALSLLILIVVLAGALLVQAPSVVAIPRATVSYDDIVEHFVPSTPAAGTADHAVTVEEHGWDGATLAVVEADPEPPNVAKPPSAPRPARVPSEPSLKSVPSVPPVSSTPDVPGVPAPPSSFSQRSGGFFESLFGSFSRGVTSTTFDDGVSRITISDGSRKITIEYAGDVEFSDDDRDVVQVSEGGYFEVEERKGRQRRHLVIEPTRDGLDRLYYENGRAAEFDEDAQEWAGDIIVEAIRNSGVGAGARVKRIRKDRGVDGVIDEIGRIESDFVKRVYVDALLDSGPLSEKESARLIETTVVDMDSDYEKAELLIALAKKRHTGLGVSRAYVAAIRTMDSDYETRRVLSACLLREDIHPEVVADLLRIASRMDSDYEQAELLIEISPQIGADTQHLEAFTLALRNIDSDFEKRRVLSALSDRRDLSPDLVELVLKLAADMDSDYEKSELLLTMANRSVEDERLMELYIDAAGGISSDYDRRRVLTELTPGDRGTQLVYEKLLAAMKGMSSDYDKAEYLRTLAATCARDAALRLRYLDACRAISSDYDMKRALELVLGEAKSDTAFLRETLATLRHIGSDYERAQLLEELSAAVAQHKTMEDEYMRQLEELSDYERDRLYRSYYRGRQVK